MTYNGAGKTSDLREHREDHLASSPSTVTPAAPECQTPGQGDLDLRNDAGKNPELSTPLPLAFAPPTITQNKPLAEITSHENCSRVGGDPGGHSPVEKGSPVLPGFRLRLAAAQDRVVAGSPLRAPGTARPPPAALRPRGLRPAHELSSCGHRLDGGSFPGPLGLSPDLVFFCLRGPPGGKSSSSNNSKLAASWMSSAEHVWGHRSRSFHA